MKAAAFDYLRASDSADAVSMLARLGDGAKLCSGSQSLGPMLNLRLAQIETLVDIRQIGALRSHSLQDGWLHIGSAVTHAHIEDGQLPDVTHGMLPTVARDIAYRAVRNRGTLGGSLAHADPAADWVSVMLLLDARVLLLGSAGVRAVLASDFFLGPFTTVLSADEVVVGVEVPVFSPTARWAYRKQCRKPGEFADAIGAAWIDPPRNTARLVVGALSSMPWVVSGLEAVAVLQHPATATSAINRLLDDAGVDDPYKRDVHAEMLRLALVDIEQPTGRTA
jgi:carbon-monoxide dehydrogenase medium subunit